MIKKCIQHIMKKNLLLLKNLQILRNSQVYDFNIKKVYIDKLDGKVNKCNSAYHNTLKPINVKSVTYVNLAKKIIKKILDLTLIFM